MPLLNLDKPIEQTCSLKQAYLWIARDILPGQVPEPGDNDRAAKLSALVTFHRDNLDRISLTQLHEKLADGTLKARGIPDMKSGISASSILDDKAPYEDAEPATEMDIPLDHLKMAGIYGIDIAKNTIYLHHYGTHYRPDQRYFDVKVFTADLFIAFPSRDGRELMYLSGEPEDGLPSPRKGQGGRPRKWDWEGALNATWAAIYSGDLKHDNRASWANFMANWFCQRDGDGETPDAREIRKRTQAMYIAIDEAGR